MMSDIRGLFPRVRLKGLFTFSAPFDSYSGIEMEVIADKTIGYYSSVGRDLLEDLYMANGLTADVFETHRTVGVRILTFRYMDSLTVDIPSFYITKIPNDVLGFKWFQFVVSLGILPETIDLTRVQESVAQVLLSDMGITTEVLLSTSEITGSVNVEDLEVQEQVRKNAVQNASTLLKDKMALEQQVENLKGQVDHLMNIIYDADITNP